MGGILSYYSSGAGRCRRWEREAIDAGQQEASSSSDSSGRTGPAMRPQTCPAQVKFAQDRQRSGGALEVAEMCSSVMGNLFWHFAFSNAKCSWQLFFSPVNYDGRSMLQLILLARWSTRNTGAEEYLWKHGRRRLLAFHGRCW